MSRVAAYEWRTLRIPFPEGEVFCWNCPLLHRGRQMCLKSGELIEDVRATGRYCDLEKEE